LPGSSLSEIDLYPPQTQHHDNTRATANGMTSPSRVVNFDRFMAPLRRRKATKEDSTVGRTVLIDGGWG